MPSRLINFFGQTKSILERLSENLADEWRKIDIGWIDNAGGVEANHGRIAA